MAEREVLRKTVNGPNSEPIYKIFMITPDNGRTPVNLSPDSISRAIQLKKGISAENILTISASTDDEMEDSYFEAPAENNYTIAHSPEATEACANEGTIVEVDSNAENSAESTVGLPIDTQVGEPSGASRSEITNSENAIVIQYSDECAASDVEINGSAVNSTDNIT
nr:unnamed protein product [Callosobruchus analis]